MNPEIYFRFKADNSGDLAVTYRPRDAEGESTMTTFYSALTLESFNKIEISTNARHSDVLDVAITVKVVEDTLHGSFLDVSFWDDKVVEQSLYQRVAADADSRAFPDMLWFKLRDDVSEVMVEQS